MRPGEMARRPTFEELEVYRWAFDAAGAVFAASVTWPDEEVHALTGQVRLMTRSLCGQIAKAWQGRADGTAFKAGFGEAEGRAAEIQSWLALAEDCGYLDSGLKHDLCRRYTAIVGRLATMSEASAAAAPLAFATPQPSQET